MFIVHRCTEHMIFVTQSFNDMLKIFRSRHNLDIDTSIDQKQHRSIIMIEIISAVGVYEE